MNEMELLSNSKEKRTAEEKHQAASHLSKLQILYKADDSELKKLLDSRKQFLENSALFYLQAAINCDSAEDVSSFVSLWFGNITDKNLNDAIGVLLQLVSSHLFVPWINQLTSRLDDENAVYAKNLEPLVCRVCDQHPYHSLYAIIGIRMMTNNDRISILRSEAGNRIWKSLSRNKSNRKLLTDTQKFSVNASKLAMHMVSRDKIKTFGFDQVSTRSWWIKELPLLQYPVPTAHIPIRQDGKYSAPVITAVERKISIASGLSAPKIVKFAASDGLEYRLLFKGGKDDLRQDCIMQQVFDELNIMFDRRPEARIRNLRIRTYKVIPLGSSGGIIEFVKNTSALIDILLPLHSQYRKNDWDISKARNVMKNAISGSVSERYNKYQEIEAHMKPVLHMFFFEQFRTPEDWITNRTKYTRSTASVSMIGYILGIGDRHCNNILLDRSTGEVVHIDLGIAFDQGKLLKVPELIPFRLTRDIVDGMGVTGVEGVFRQSCQVSMRILRDEAEGIRTILNVLRYDPLYRW